MIEIFNLTPVNFRLTQTDILENTQILYCLKCGEMSPIVNKLNSHIEDYDNFVNVS